MLILGVATRNRLPCMKNAYFQVRHLASQAQPKKETSVSTSYKLNLPGAKPKLPKREPFVKNLFLGKFDYEFLTYPEPQHVDRYTEFEVWLQPIKEYMKTVNPKELEITNTIPSHVLQNFRELGVFAARIPEDYYGMNLLNSEFMRVLETVGTVPALGLFLLKQGVSPIDILNKYGTVEQKLKYFPKIAKGESFATVAITENNTGPGVTNCYETIAISSMDEEYWELNGEKMFVSNANLSDIFIVYGHAVHTTDMEKRPESITSFIVEANTPGLTVVKDSIETVGLKGFNTGRIILKDVKIPKENIIGKVGMGSSQLIDIFTNGRHFIASISISILKNYLHLLTKEIIHRKQFKEMMYDTDSAQQALSKITYAIYAIESILYLTTATMDIYDNQDVQLETALVEQYSVQTTLRVIQDTMWLVGPRACTLVKPFEKILRDAFTLSNYETSLFDTKIYAALLGLQHIGMNLGDIIKKQRNILFNPKLMFEILMYSGKKKTLGLSMDQYLHPSFRECTVSCDKSILLLKTVAQEMLLRDGLNVGEKHAELQRLSDIVSFIYVYIAILGRASRSYCIGNRDSESEVKLAVSMAWQTQKRVQELAEEIDVSEFTNGDYLNREVAKLSFERKKYFAAHPLQRNY